MKSKFLILWMMLSPWILSAQYHPRKTPEKPRPNVIIIKIDDLGLGEIGPGLTHKYRTPNIDALFASGMYFDHFYSTQSVCSASEAALLTGCYPNRLGISGTLSRSSHFALNRKEETIGSVLKQAGYKTAFVGNWSLGADSPFTPLHYGFDEFEGMTLFSGLSQTPLDSSSWEDSLIIGLDSSSLIDSVTDALMQPIQQEMALNELTAMYTDKAIEFIQRNRKNKFFLYLSHPMLHGPLHVSSDFEKKSGDGIRGDVMEELDWSVGQILDKVKSCGIEENTIIILLSDHGPDLGMGQEAGSTGGLRGGKTSVWEGGLRVPFIIQWKGRIQARSICNAFITSMDILPSLVNLCGARMPVKRVDGLYVGFLFTDPKAESPRQEFAYYGHRNSLMAIRKNNWKLIFPHVSGSDGVGTSVQSTGMEVSRSAGQIELSLYDLDEDPGEKNNLSQVYPDIVEDLLKLAVKYRRDLGDDLIGVKAANTRPAEKTRP